MKNVVLIVIGSMLFYCTHAQYYLRGEIKDENNSLLPNVKILLHSSGYTYYSGSSGAFGIPVPGPSDSLTLSAAGFQTISLRVDVTQYQTLQLKATYRPPVIPKNRLLSFTRDLKPTDWKSWTVGGETYSSLVENEFVPARRFPETGFALTIDKASYSNVRRFLNMGSTVPPDAIRIEEMLNYFNPGYKDPPPDSNFLIRSVRTTCPWNPKDQLLYLHICARKIDPSKIPPANLVFLIDVSGSMDLPNKLPLLKSAFGLLVNNLRSIDTVSIVVYGSTVGVWLPPTSGGDKKKIRQSIEDLYPGGPTPGEAGIRAAYRVAKSQFIPGGNNRVILATDGDFNVGETSEQEMENLVTQYKEWGIYLTCLGVGMGNYKDSKLEALAKTGNGNFAYLDDGREAEKVLVKEFTQTVYAVADDAYLNITFNPKLVADYRLIGFDNKYKVLSDSLHIIQGGEVGSGHSLLAMFEIRPRAAYATDQDVLDEDADTTQRALIPDNPNNEPAFSDTALLARVALNYRLPRDSLEHTTGFECRQRLTPFTELASCYRFAAAVAMFGGMLKHSRFTAQASWKDVISIATGASDPMDNLQQEFIGLVTRAKKIYAHQRKHAQPY